MNTEINQRFKEEIERLGLKKTELSAELKTTRRTFHRIIAGQSSVKAELVTTFAEKYDIDMMYIMTGTPNNERILMPNTKEISKRLNEQLAQKDVNKSKMAEELNITRSTLYRMLNGESSIKVEHLAEIAKRYEIDTNYVISGVKSGTLTLLQREEEALLEIIEEDLRDRLPHISKQVLKSFMEEQFTIKRKSE